MGDYVEGYTTDPAEMDQQWEDFEAILDTFVAGGGDQEIPLAILGVKREYLRAAFDEMQTKYGTIENYFFDGLGIDAARQKALRDLYLQ